MARIRTIKPEFWTDDLLGSISREARLLFIAAWNIADDEGLLRWTAPTLKGAVFPFDDDIGIAQVEAYMLELEGCEVVFPYVGGRSQQKLAYIVNFLKHQKINRPGPSKLPPPPLQNAAVKEMYAKRDGHLCHLCAGEIDLTPVKYDGDFFISVDHLVPVSRGGSDYPSNIRASHITCNKGRGNRSREEYMALVMTGKTVAQLRHPERFAHVVVSDSVNPSVTEGEQGTGTGIGNEEKEQEKAEAPAALAPDIACALEEWNSTAEELHLPKAQLLTEKRQRHLRKRLASCGGLEGWRVMLAKIRGSPGLQGSDGGWKAHFDFAVSEAGFTKIMEGKYDGWGTGTKAKPSGLDNGFAKLVAGAGG